MDQTEHEAFCQAVRDRLDALNAIYVADFNCDDSGCMTHILPLQEDCA